MIKCLNCKKLIENPRRFRGEIVQKFCSDDCRFRWHNRRKKEKLGFLAEIMSFSKKVFDGEGV